MDDRTTIVVDLTPLLPGAVNGGAKILVLELLRLLPKLTPETRFILLTRRSSHDELQELEGTNVTRKLVWNDIETTSNSRRNRISDRLLQQATVITRNLPVWLQRIRYDVRRLLTVRPSSLTHENYMPTLLFSPFGLSESFGGLSFSPADLPTVAILYDLQHRRYPQFFDAAEFAKRERNLRSHGATSVMAAISNFVRDDAIETGVIAESQVFTIYIRLQHRIVEVSERQAAGILRSFALSADGYLLYPANFWPHKNHDALLKAFSMARSEGLPADLKLVCTGAPGEQLAASAKAADARGLKEAVVFLGFLDDPQFAALLRSARGVVFPSLYEGFGMPVIEAMAVGCAVACSNTTSLSEVAGDAALLFDPQEPSEIARAIFQLATDEELRAVLVEKGFRRAKFFADTEHMAREYLQLFDYAIDRAKSRPVVSEQLYGVHGDGWAAPSIIVHYGNGRGDRSLHVQFQVPDWLPIRHYELSIPTAAQGRLERHWLKPGDTPKIEIPIGSEAGTVEMHIKPFFRPIELRVLANTTESRELTVIVQRIEIREAEKSITIFPRTSAA